jgi:hypothetical protein
MKRSRYLLPLLAFLLLGCNSISRRAYDITLDGITERVTATEIRTCASGRVVCEYMGGARHKDTYVKSFSINEVTPTQLPAEKEVQ